MARCVTARSTHPFEISPPPPGCLEGVYLYNTLLKPKRHSLRCHGFVVHALLLRMNYNVVDFRIMRRLCHREWNDQRNWQSVNHIPGIHDNGPRDHGVWRLTLSAYWTSRSQRTLSRKPGGGGVFQKGALKATRHKAPSPTLSRQTLISTLDGFCYDVV